MRSTKVAADEAGLGDAEVADMDILVREDSDKRVVRADDGELKFCSSGGANEGRIECEVTEFLKEERGRSRDKEPMKICGSWAGGLPVPLGKS